MSGGLVFVIPDYGEPAQLDPDDIARAIACTHERFGAVAGKPQYRDRFGQDSLESHLKGVLCEMAVANWAVTSWFCRSLVFKEGGDVAGHEVRRATLTYGLPIHDEATVGKGEKFDPVGRKVIAVRPAERDYHTCLDYWIMGWHIVGEEQPEWQQNPGNRRLVTMVPVQHLRKMSTFPLEEIREVNR